MAKTKILFLFISLFFTSEIFAQNYFSPYSRYGLGDMHSTHLLRHRAMGGTSFAVSDSTTFSISNPASYAEIKAFVLETGVTATYFDLKSGGKTFTDADFQMPYLTFALPLLPQSKRHEWGFNLALSPYSRTGYRSKLVSNDVISREEYFNGTGGFSKFSLGSAIKLVEYKAPSIIRDSVQKTDSVTGVITYEKRTRIGRNRTSKTIIGANAGYLFGQQTLQHRILFPDSTRLYTLDRSTKVIASGFVFDVGAIWKTTMGKTGSLQVGVTANLPSDINARREMYANTIYPNEDVVSDSVLSGNGAEGFMELPIGYGAGLVFTRDNSFRNKDKNNVFSVAFDVYQRKWSEYRIFGNTEPVRDFSSFSGGFEFKPNSTATSSFLSRMKYRFGGRMSQGIYNLGNVQPLDQSFSLGVGLPFRNAQSSIYPSFLDFTLEAGQITGLNNLEQRYIIFSLGIHLTEASWYNRNKID